MQELANWSTSVLVTAGLIVYLDAIPINVNNATKYQEIDKVQQERVAKKTIKKFIGNRIIDRFRSTIRLQINQLKF